MLFGEVEHALDLGTCPLLAELHLQDGIVNGLARNLSPKFVEFPLRNLEVGRRVLVLKTATGESASKVKQSRNRYEPLCVSCGALQGRPE